MFEHPYFTHQVTMIEQEEIERRAARRRFLAEHADQIVVRPGLFARMLRRVAPAPARVAPVPERAAGEPRTVASCEPAVAR